jgi:hypothetical protein
MEFEIMENDLPSFIDVMLENSKTIKIVGFQE